MEFTYPAPADPSSVSPEGHTILRAEECFPYALHGYGGPEAWDGPLRRELVAIRNSVLAELVRDWDDAVLDSYDWTPLDNWRLNRDCRCLHARCLQEPEARESQPDAYTMETVTGSACRRRVTMVRPRFLSMTWLAAPDQSLLRAVHDHNG